MCGIFGNRVWKSLLQCWLKGDGLGVSGDDLGVSGDDFTGRRETRDLSTTTESPSSTQRAV
jgi:hypothetical protein